MGKVIGRQRQVAADVEDAAPQVGGVSVGDRQAAYGHVQAGCNFEDTAGVVAADGQSVGPRTVDRHTTRDEQFAAGKRDGAVQAAGKGDGVDAWAGIGRGDLGPQGTGAAVLKVQDGEGAGQAAVFERLQAEHEGRSPCLAVGSVQPGTAFAARSALQPLEELGQCHGSSLVHITVRGHQEKHLSRRADRTPKKMPGTAYLFAAVQPSVSQLVPCSLDGREL
jgi:hypothetical protein